VINGNREQQGTESRTLGRGISAVAEPESAAGVDGARHERLSSADHVQYIVKKNGEQRMHDLVALLEDVPTNARRD
jgi:hypothetical protein